jgi:hypothetical protein
MYLPSIRVPVMFLNGTNMYRGIYRFTKGITGMRDDESSDKELDVLWGAKAIAQVINRTRRQTHHLLHQGAIDAAKKVGGRWCADRGGLRRQFYTPSKPGQP